MATTLPVLAQQLASLDTRLSNKLVTAQRALEALAGQLMSLGMMAKVPTAKNPLAGQWWAQQGVLCCAVYSRFASHCACSASTTLHVHGRHEHLKHLQSRTPRQRRACLLINMLAVIVAALSAGSDAMKLLDGKMEAVRTALAASVRLLLQEMTQDAAITAALAASPRLQTGDLTDAASASCEVSPA